MKDNKKQEEVLNKLEEIKYENLYDLIYELKENKLITEAEFNMGIHAYHILHDLFWHVDSRKEFKISLPEKLL